MNPIQKLIIKIFFYTGGTSIQYINEELKIQPVFDLVSK